ncbi:hypothetical protein SCARD494_07447 [Seiridium cardinale]
MTAMKLTKAITLLRCGELTNLNPFRLAGEHRICESQTVRMDGLKTHATVEESHWTTDWSARELTPAECNDFENTIADLYDWVALSVDACEAVVKRQLNTPPSSVTQERRRAYFAAILRYIVVELVMCSEDDENGTVQAKLKKLVGLISYLVSDIRAVDVEFINQELESIYKSDEAYPSLIGHGASKDTIEQELATFNQLHDFSIKLYTKKLLSSLVPITKAFDAYFGAQPIREAVTFYVVTRWLTCAHGDIYQASSEFQIRWPSWYSLICQQTAEYGKEQDRESMRLAISGRAAQKRMEVEDEKLAAFDKAIRQGLDEAALEPPPGDMDGRTTAEKSERAEIFVRKLTAAQPGANPLEVIAQGLDDAQRGDRMHRPNRQA